MQINMCVCAYVECRQNYLTSTSCKFSNYTTKKHVGTNAVCAAWRPQKGGCFGRGRVGTETWAAGWMCDRVSKKQQAQINGHFREYPHKI